MTKYELSPKAVRLLHESLFVDVHNHLMFEYAIREALGQPEIFDNFYAPVLRKGGINVIATSVGGNSPCVCNLTDNLVHGSLEQIDMLLRAEAQSATFRICHNAVEVQQAVAEGRIGVLLAMEPGPGHIAR